jgi:uncharacterized membrane protein
MLDLPLAIALTLIGSVLKIFAFVFEKKGQNQIPQDVHGLNRIFRSAKTPIWDLGFILAISTFPLTIISINAGYLSVLMPLYNFGMLVLVLLGIVYLKEKVTKNELIGIAILIVGVVLLGFSTESNGLVKSVSVVCTAVYIIILAAVPFVISLFYKDRALFYSLVAGVVISIAVILVKIISITITAMPGMSNGLNIFSIQLDENLIFGIFFPGWQVLSLLTWGVILFIVFHEVALIFAFKTGRAMFVVPIEKVSSIAMPAIAGFLLFQESANPIVIIGFVLSLIGSVILTKLQIQIEKELESNRAAAGPEIAAPESGV